MGFVEGLPAFKFGRSVVIADVHFGFEKSLEQKGYAIPSQERSIIDSIKNLASLSKRLIVLGDLKHDIVPSPKQGFCRLLSAMSDSFDSVIVVKGNHDSNIERYVSGYENISVAGELLLRKTLLIHGHKYASDGSLRKARTILMGHFHSSFKTRDYLGNVVSLKCWTIYDFDNKLFFGDRGVRTRIKEVVSFPTFNPFFNGSNEKNGPFAKYMHVKEAFSLQGIKLL